MKIQIAFLFFLLFASLTQAIRVDGRVYLEDEIVHDGIEVSFERTAPFSLYDTTYTDATGYFSIDLELGIYNVNYFKPGYFPILIEDIVAYSSSTIPETTLESSGLSGALVGTLATGTYTVGFDIYVPEGETLLIEPGTILRFRDSVKFTVNGVLFAEGTETDTIVFTRLASTGSWGGILLEYSARGSRISYSFIEYGFPGGITANYISGYLIEKSRFEHNPNGIFLQGCEGLIRESLFQNNQVGIYVAEDRSIIRKAIFQQNARWGISIGWGITTSIENCLIINNITSGGDAAGIYCLSCNPETRIINTHVVGNRGGGGIIIGYNAPPILNCLIADNYPFGIHGAPLNHNIFNNNVWNNGTNFEESASEWLGANLSTNANGDSIDAYGNIQLDPMFADAMSGDYHLLSGSPCLDAGAEFFIISSDTTWAPLIDFSDNIRPLGPRWDIGVYEGYVSAIGESPSAKPEEISLNAYPNPFNSAVTISVGASHASPVTIEIFDINGRMVARFGRLTDRNVNPVAEPVEAAEMTLREITWQPDENIGSGVYLVRVQFGEGEITKRIVYLK